MSQTTAPALDFAAESAGSPWEIALIVFVGVLAFAYLARGIWRKRQNSLSGKGCAGCAGCGSSGGTCDSVPEFKTPEEKS